MINNYEIIKRFMPGEVAGPLAGDAFLYTELLDRTKRVGNNGVRVVKAFYHRSLLDFDRHMAQMIALCDALKVRAYTRLSPRSFKQVGVVFTKMVVEAALTNNHAGMKSLYARACGTTAHQKTWLFDVDAISDASNLFGNWLAARELLMGIVPSKKGLHYITRAFDLRNWNAEQSPSALTLLGVPDVSLHKDNATNLYIPDEAA